MHYLLISHGHKPRTGKVFTCSVCGKEFYRQITLFPKNAPLCSYKCMGKSKERQVLTSCHWCKREYSVAASILKWNEIRGHEHNFCSVKCRGSYYSGDRHPLWYSDRSLVKCRPNGNKAHALWRDEVFSRDDFTCQRCGKRGGYLEANHVMPYALFPANRYEVLNGETLCRKCHNTTKVHITTMKRIWMCKTD